MTIVAIILRSLAAGLAGVGTVLLIALHGLGVI